MQTQKRKKKQRRQIKAKNVNRARRHAAYFDGSYNGFHRGSAVHEDLVSDPDGRLGPVVFLDLRLCIDRPSTTVDHNHGKASLPSIEC